MVRRKNQGRISPVLTIRRKIKDVTLDAAPQRLCRKLLGGAL